MAWPRRCGRVRGEGRTRSRGVGLEDSLATFPVQNGDYPLLEELRLSRNPKTANRVSFGGNSSRDVTVPIDVVRNSKTDVVGFWVTIPG